MFKRYFMVKNKTGNGDAVSFANGTVNADTFDVMKMGVDDSNLPTGGTVIEYLDREEAEIAALSVAFNDYSGVSDVDFAKLYEKFTTNDKNIGRVFRQSINAWSAKNTVSWPNSYHSAVWTNYDELEQRLSDGALVPAYLVFITIPNIINDPVTTDNIDMTTLNTMVGDMFAEVFDKFPR